MYDRKTWIVLSICGTLLAANLYYTQKQNAEKLREQKTLEAMQKAAAPDEKPPEPQATLTVEPPPPIAEESTLTLSTEKVAFTFTNIGGGIKDAKFLNQYEVGSKTEHVQANRFGPGPIGTLANADRALQNVPYAVATSDDKHVSYTAKLPSGLQVTKTYSLIESEHAGAPYLLNLSVDLVNTSSAPLDLHQWSLFLGEASPLYEREAMNQTCFFWSSGGDIEFKHAGKFQKGMFSAAKSLITSPNDQAITFAGVTNQFFITALQPLNSATTSVWGEPAEIKLPGSAGKTHPAVKAGLRFPSVTLSPGQSQSIGYRVFTGPSHYATLAKMEKHWGDGWGDLIHYGFFSSVSHILNRILNVYHGWISHVADKWSWGLSIILLTITVRALIWPLHAKSTHTMKRMAMLKPEMDKLREKYPDDPNKLNTETMGLYRKYGINPIGGCLPMLIQIPIFLGLFSMLQYAVEFRGQGFLWVDDLSQPDTLAAFKLPFSLPLIGSVLNFNILPIVMAITSYLQIQMTPMSGDPNQQRIMKLMPLMFFFFCYNFASALALYWTTQNIFSIGQTWLMSKVPEPALKPVKGGGKSWMQRMAERQAELQKAQKNARPGAQPQMRDANPKKRPPRTGG